MCVQIVILAFTCQTSFALEPNRALTQYVHRIWQTPQGLPQATIYAIRQTRDGYLWLGTPGGLVRFDGVRFTTINEVAGQSLGAPSVVDLLEDAGGAIWLATDGTGILRIDHDKLTRFTHADGLSSDTVRDLFADRNGELWAATSGGLARFADGKWIAISGEQESPLVDVYTVCQTLDGSILTAGDGPYIGIWDGANFTSRRLVSVPTSASVRAMLCAKDGTVWIGTTHGLIQLRNGIERCFTGENGLADDWVFCLTEGREGSLWAGTKSGFSRIQEGEIESFRTRDGLSQSTVYTLFLDYESNLWAGTKYGLNQFLDRRTVPFTVSEGLPSNDTGPVIQDREGNIWVATLDAGLSRFDGRHFSVITTKQGLASDVLLSLAADASGLWVGTDRGLNRLSNGRVVQTFTTADGLPSDVVRGLLQDHKGVLWIGTASGLAMIRDGKLTTPPGIDSRVRLPILALGEHAGKLIVATEGGGLYSFSEGSLQPISQGGLPNRDIDALSEDSDGLLWMGTHGGGLRVLDGMKVSQYSIHDGLYDDEIYGIVTDNQGRIWLACSKGVFWVNRSDLKRFAAGEISSFVSSPFSPTDNLRTIECQPGVQPVAWRTSDGHIWFSTIHGVIVIDSDHMERKLLPPPVRVEEMIVNGKSERPEEIKYLEAGQSNLEFRYTALTFRASSRITFRYKLDGFDKDWLDAGTRREAFYTNLPPSTYRFRVSAGNIDGTWTEAASSPVFTLAPHIYQRKWFLPVCAGMVALAGWFAYRQRVRRIKGEMNMILAERSRIARELHDTLMQGFSGITMEMQALSTALPESPQRMTLHEIIRDAGNCLREARRSIAGLRTGNSRLSGLAASIDEAARHITDAKDVRLKLSLAQGPQGLATEVEYNLLRIAQEAMTNAVKHARARNMHIALECNQHQLILSVKDDGCGFRADKLAEIPPGHYGLIGMRERAKQASAEFRVESTPGRGTTITVKLALRKVSGGLPELDARPAPASAEV